LLEQEQNDREIYYHLNPQKIKEIADFIEPFRILLKGYVEPDIVEQMDGNESAET
jgi:hypothetical protein